MRFRSRDSIPDTDGFPAAPRWDTDTRTLYCGEWVVKRMKHLAPSQEPILAAFEEEGWRRRIDDRKQRRIPRLDREQGTRAGSFGGGKLRLGVPFGENADRLSCMARQLRQRAKRLARPAAMIDQLAKRRRSDAGGPDQPETGEAFSVVEDGNGQRRGGEQGRVTLWHRSSAPPP